VRLTGSAADREPLFEPVKTGANSALGVGFAAWYVIAMRTLALVAVLLALGGCKNTKVCRAEHDALQPLLPAIDEMVGEAIDVDASKPGPEHFSYPVVEVREECSRRGYRVLVVLGELDFDSDAPSYRQVGSINDARTWVEGLVADGHNPRTLKRTLSIKVIGQDLVTSVTGVKRYYQIAKSGYSPKTDSVRREGHDESEEATRLLEDHW
jgi:hypothetical protein